MARTFRSTNEPRADRLKTNIVATFSTPPEGEFMANGINSLHLERVEFICLDATLALPA